MKYNDKSTYNSQLYNTDISASAIINTRIITLDVLSNNVIGTIVVSPVFSNASNKLYIPQVDYLSTDGDTTILIPANVNMLYKLEVAELFTYIIAYSSSTIDGEILGITLRNKTNQPTGAVTKRTVTGNMYDIVGGTSDLYIRINEICVDLAGNIIVPKPISMNVNQSTGAVSLDLIPTTNLYSLNGATILYEIIFNKPSYPIVGKVGFTVPAGSGGLTFSTSNGSIIVV